MHSDQGGFGRIFAVLSRGIGVTQGLALCGIVALILASIILRNFFDYGLVWVFEAAGFLMVTLVFLGTPKNIHHSEDIAVDFVTARAGATFQKLAWYFRKLVVLAVSATFAYQLYHHSLRFGHLRTPTLEMSHWLFYASAMIGPALAVLITLWQISLGLRGKASYERT